MLCVCVCSLHVRLTFILANSKEMLMFNLLSFNVMCFYFSFSWKNKENTKNERKKSNNFSSLKFYDWIMFTAEEVAEKGQ